MEKILHFLINFYLNYYFSPKLYKVLQLKNICLNIYDISLIKLIFKHVKFIKCKNKGLFYFYMYPLAIIWCKYVHIDIILIFDKNIQYKSIIKLFPMSIYSIIITKIKKLLEIFIITCKSVIQLPKNGKNTSFFN